MSLSLSTPLTTSTPSSNQLHMQLLKARQFISSASAPFHDPNRTGIHIPDILTQATIDEEEETVNTFDYLPSTTAIINRYQYCQNNSLQGTSTVTTSSLSVGSSSSDLSLLTGSSLLSVSNSCVAVRQLVESRI